MKSVVRVQGQGKVKGMGLRGLSAVPAAFGFSPSTVSRRFIRASATKPQELCERRLEAYDFVALVLDGKTVADDAMVITLHRLGLFGPLGISLTTTNCLESLLAQVGGTTDKVDRWRSSDQKQRWVASALLAIEPRLRRLKGYRHLPLLRVALQREVVLIGQQHEGVA